MSLKFLLFLFLSQCASSLYKVSAVYDSPNSPIISSQNKAGMGASEYTYAYNVAYLPNLDQPALLLRCRNVSGGNLGPSVLATSVLQKNGTWSDVRKENVVFSPSDPHEKGGTEDPRITYIDGTWYLFYTAYAGTSRSGQLWLATCNKNPLDANCWKRHGSITNQTGIPTPYKSGSLLVLPDTDHNDDIRGYLFLLNNGKTRIATT
eukprot:UN28160